MRGRAASGPVTGMGRRIVLDWPEATLQAHIVDAAGRLGYLTFHPYDSRRSSKGFPDLVLLHRRTGALLLAELKSTAGKLSREQDLWLETLHLGGHAAFVWRPADWLDGIVTATLIEHAKVTR
jgi:VRR-NUC domain